MYYLSRVCNLSRELYSLLLLRIVCLLRTDAGRFQYVYEFHITIFQNKKTYGDKLLCSQGGCPRNFTRFQTLTTHIARAHYNVVGIGDPSVRKANGYAGEVNSDGAIFLPIQLRLCSRL